MGRPRAGDEWKEYGPEPTPEEEPDSQTMDELLQELAELSLRHGQLEGEKRPPLVDRPPKEKPERLTEDNVPGNIGVELPHDKRLEQEEN